MYLENMRKTCTDRATNPEWPLELLKSISGEFDKGLNGGIFDPSYVLSKLAPLTRHVKWLEGQAEEEAQKRYGSEEDEELEEHDETEQFSSGYNGGYGQSTLEDDRE